MKLSAMPHTQTGSKGTKKLIDQSADRIAENSSVSTKNNTALKKRLRQFFSF